MSDVIEIPGGKPQLKKRDLHLYFLLDTSGSMEEGGKIQSLNEAIRQAAPIIRDAASNEARGNLIVHAIEFNSGARWISAELAQGIPGAQFEWSSNLEANGETDMGLAMEMVSQTLPHLPNNAFRPVLVLVTDGMPSDNFSGGLRKLLDVPWGKHAFRLAIAIGEDADLDTCQQFIGNKELKPMRAHNVNDIQRYMRFVSMVAGSVASSGKDLNAAQINAQAEGAVAQNNSTVVPESELAGAAAGASAANPGDWV